MELPHLGTNCALKACNRLDFLPVKCDACSKTFCVEHYKYDTHNCELAKRKDVQVPLCPLCMEPVVGKRDELPDVAVSQHIDQYCKANETIKKRKTKQTNLQTCSFKSCKQKDLIYLECHDCRSKFCIKHRHPSDHTCPGSSMTNNLADNWQSFKGSCSTSASSGYNMIINKAQQISRSGQAALNRLANKNTTSQQAGRSSNSIVGSLQGQISEQEALAIALRQSSETGAAPNRNRPETNMPSQEDEDLALARAIHESQLNSGGSTVNAGNSNHKDTCMVS